MNLLHNAYNSDKFQIRMADLDNFSGGESVDQLSEIVDDAVREGYQHISAKVSTSNKRLLNELMAAGFRLVDTHVDYLLDCEKAKTRDLEGDAVVRGYAEADLDALMNIARGSYSIDRWHSDPCLPDDLCDAYYAEWVRSCAAGYARHILVIEDQGEQAGFMTIREADNGEASRIDLTAIAAQHRGKGFYHSLVSEAIRWSKREGYRRMYATTQINNYGSQHTWISHGFNVVASRYILHMGLN